MIIGKPGYDHSPISWYAASKSVYGWSLQTQMQARAHALDTGARRLKSFGPDPIYSRACVFCGEEQENEHHIFVTCPKHAAWREASNSAISKHTFTLEIGDCDLLGAVPFWADAILCDDIAWPSEGRSQYFTGFLPTLDSVQLGFSESDAGKSLLNFTYHEVRKLTGRIFGARISAVTRRSREEGHAQAVGAVGGSTLKDKC